jgi:phosphohistidine phosphatase SixA
MQFNRSTFIRAVTLFLSAAWASVALSQPTQMEGKALTDALKKGGYVLFIRHAATDMTIGDKDLVVISDCSTQRNLSVQGRIDARAMGTAFDRLQIPVGQVLSAPYCRTIETARLAFARADASESLIEQRPQNETTAKVAEAGLRPLLAKVPAVGTNTILVSHGFNLRAISGFGPAEGEAVVYQPDAKGGFNLVARVLVANWGALAQ